MFLIDLLINNQWLFVFLFDFFAHVLGTVIVYVNINICHNVCIGLTFQIVQQIDSATETRNSCLMRRCVPVGGSITIMCLRNPWFTTGVFTDGVQKNNIHIFPLFTYTMAMPMASDTQLMWVSRHMGWSGNIMGCQVENGVPDYYAVSLPPSNIPIYLPNPKNTDKSIMI